MTFIMIYLAIVYLVGMFYIKDFLGFVAERKHAAPPGVTDERIKVVLVLLFIFLPVITPYMMLKKLTK